MSDLDEVQEEWEEALADLLDTWGPISDAQRADLVAQVRDAVDSGDIDALADLGLDTTDAADELAAAMEDLAGSAAQQMADTAAAQGVEVAAGTVDAAALASIAAVIAGLLAAGLAVSAGLEALRLATPGKSGDDVAQGVDDHLSSLSDSYLAAHLGGALSAAQARGRFATLEVAPVASYRSDESNDDRNRCGPCEAEDGTEFATLDEAWAAYGNGTYVECEGRWRCRGAVTASWD